MCAAGIKDVLGGTALSTVPAEETASLVIFRLHTCNVRQCGAYCVEGYCEN